jgi:UDP-glucose 4-epimerase
MCNTSERNLSGINKILNTELPFHNVDCTDLKQMEDIYALYEDIHACIHFAAYKSVEDSVKHPEKYYKNNIGSLETLLKCLEQTKFKNLIFSSSCTVYGMPDKLPVDERAPFKKAESPYGETKQKCELLIQNNNCNSVSLRYFNPIGSHESGLIGDCSSDNASNLVPIVAEVAAGLRPKLTVNGNDYDTHDGTCVRDYIHVQDLAIAHVKALDYLLGHEVKEVFNVGTGHGLSVLDIVTAFEASNNLKLKYTIGDRRAGDVEKIYADGAKIKKVLGWKAVRTTEEALIAAWNWQKSTQDA